jgi:hypothetical protein
MHRLLVYECPSSRISFCSSSLAHLDRKVSKVVAHTTGIDCWWPTFEGEVCILLRRYQTWEFTVLFAVGCSVTCKVHCVVIC